jgi:hypothetical protein
VRRAYAFPPRPAPHPRPARPPAQHVAETRYRDSSGPPVRNRSPGGWGGGDSESPAHAPRFPYRLGIHGTVWGFGLRMGGGGGLSQCVQLCTWSQNKFWRSNSVPRAPDEEDQSATGLLLCTYSAGPVSPICFTDLKGRELLRAVTLDDSTPQ